MSFFQTSFKCRSTFHGHFQRGWRTLWKESVSGTDVPPVDGSVLQASPAFSPASWKKQGVFPRPLLTSQLMGWNPGSLKEQKEVGAGKHCQYLTKFFFCSHGYFCYLTQIQCRNCGPIVICMTGLHWTIKILFLHAQGPAWHVNCISDTHFFVTGIVAIAFLHLLTVSISTAGYYCLVPIPKIFLEVTH